MRLGFAVTTYNRPLQAIRLFRALETLFDSPIVCHHNFSQSDLPQWQLPGSVQLVRPHLNSGWGNTTFVEAMLAAINVLMTDHSKVDWIYVLSGSDYPIAPPAKIADDLRSIGADVAAHAEKLFPEGRESEYCEMLRRRYVYPALRVPWPTGSGIRWRRKLLPALSPWVTPFSDAFPAYGGGSWFCLSAEAASRVLLAWHRNKDWIRRHFRHRSIVDECIWPTLLANHGGRVHPDAFRYTRFKSGKPNPEILTCKDLPDILASGAHFARKFDPEVDSDVLDELDRMLIGKKVGDVYLA